MTGASVGASNGFDGAVVRFGAPKSAKLLGAKWGARPEHRRTVCGQMDGQRFLACT